MQRIMYIIFYAILLTEHIAYSSIGVTITPTYLRARAENFYCGGLLITLKDTITQDLTQFTLVSTIYFGTPNKYLELGSVSLAELKNSSLAVKFDDVGRISNAEYRIFVYKKNPHVPNSYGDAVNPSAYITISRLPRHNYRCAEVALGTRKFVYHPLNMSYE